MVSTCISLMQEQVVASARRAKAQGKQRVAKDKIVIEKKRRDIRVRVR